MGGLLQSIQRWLVQGNSSSATKHRFDFGKESRKEATFIALRLLWPRASVCNDVDLSVCCQFKQPHISATCRLLNLSFSLLRGGIANNEDHPVTGLSESHVMASVLCAASGEAAGDFPNIHLRLSRLHPCINDQYLTPMIQRFFWYGELPYFR